MLVAGASAPMLAPSAPPSGRQLTSRRGVLGRLTEAHLACRQHFDHDVCGVRGFDFKASTLTSEHALQHLANPRP